MGGGDPKSAPQGTKGGGPQISPMGYQGGGAGTPNQPQRAPRGWGDPKWGGGQVGAGGGPQITPKGHHVGGGDPNQPHGAPRRGGPQISPTGHHVGGMVAPNGDMVTPSDPK